MAQLEKELEKQLLEAGNKLLSPPSSVPELLALLDRVEKFLTRVEQSPSESMNKALSPSMKALIADNLLKHSNVDVRVAVASCISEITRVTAPDAPYEDDQMKEVFQLIVSSFENLDDKCSPSYVKRTTILETVAKVRSCVVMLDLECDALIVEMFQHFLRSIRDDYPENVFSSMETIMTLILEESEEVSLDLALSILDFLKTDNKEALPIARQLGEKVIEKCGGKLKPYLLPALKSRGASLNDYSKVLADVCQMAPEAVEPSDGDAASKNSADESDLGNAPSEKAVEVAMETLDDAPPSEEVGASVARSSKSVVSNGTIQEIEDTSVGTDNTKEADHSNHDGVKTDAEPSKVNVDSLDDGEHSKSQSKPEKSNRRKGRKTSALKSSSKPTEPTGADVKKETDKVPEEQERDGKDVDGTSKDALADDAGPAKNKRESDALVSSPKTSENENENEAVDIPSPSPRRSLADESCSRKVGQGKKDELVQEGVPASDDSKKESDIDSKKESDSDKASDETDVLESKTKRTSKKASSEADKEEQMHSPVDASKKEDNLDAKSVTQQSRKKVEVLSGQSEDRNKRGEGKGTSSKDPAKTPTKEEGKKPLPKSTEKSTKDGSDVEKSSRTSSKRKRSPGKEKASGTKGYGEELVGSKIEVWWPADKKFYKGFVEYFDSVKMKHKIVYDDGDVEVLKLAKEKWKWIENDSLPDEEHTSDGESPDEASETPKGKKAKTSQDSQAKGGKVETKAKTGGASSSKSKSTPKFGRKDNKVDGKSMEESSKSIAKSDQDKGGKSEDSKAGNKSSNETPKPVGKYKDDNWNASKGTDKSKQDAPKGAMKPRVKSPKTNSKANMDDTSKVKAGSSLKDEEAEDTEESPERTKTSETAKQKSPSASKSQKSGKKRKSGGRS